MRVAKIEYMNGCDGLKTTYYTYDASEEKALLSKTKCRIGKIRSTREKALLSKTECLIGKISSTWEEALLLKTTPRTGSSLGRRNVMATYSEERLSVVLVEGQALLSYALSEHHIYGASRLGVDNRNLELTTATILYSSETNFCTEVPLGYYDLTQISYDQSYREVGLKFYELSNHLGNVLEVITDRKVGYDDGTYDMPFGTWQSSTLDDEYDFYTADIVSYSDYYPYGMLMNGRHNSEAEGYRYGFQGQEMDDEIKGEGNSVNYKYHMHDPRIGRFFAVDPLASEYPHNSPYAFSENSTIAFVELEGLEKLYYLESRHKDKTTGKTVFASVFWKKDSGYWSTDENGKQVYKYYPLEYLIGDYSYVYSDVHQLRSFDTKAEMNGYLNDKTQGSVSPFPLPQSAPSDLFDELTSDFKPDSWKFMEAFEVVLGTEERKEFSAKHKNTVLLEEHNIGAWKDYDTRLDYYSDVYSNASALKAGSVSKV